MVSVRPTVKVLKTLYAGGKLTGQTAAAYECAKRADDSNVKLEYLRQAVESAQSEVALITYIQGRFNNRIFERYKSLDSPVFEARDATNPAWRGAVIHPGGNYAWMVYVGVHDHFHSEIQRVFQEMERSGTLGPSAVDLTILDRQRHLELQRDFERVALLRTVPALKEASATRVPVGFEVGPLAVEVEVETVPFEEWDVATSHNMMDLVSFRIGNWQSNQAEFQNYLRAIVGYMRAGDEMVEALYHPRFVLQIAVSRADLISFMDTPSQDQLIGVRATSEPDMLHYSSKGSLVEAYVTGRAVQAICGKWWVPTGDEHTHRHLPICPDCERSEPVAQALKSFLKTLDGRGPLTDL